MIKVNDKWKHTEVELEEMRVGGKEPRLQYWKNVSKEDKLSRNKKISASNSNKPKSALHRMAISKAYSSEAVKSKVSHFGAKNGMYGRKRTLAEKENQRKKMTLIWNQDLYKDLKREQRMLQTFPKKNTLIELKIKSFLQQLNIPFKMHKAVMGVTQPDFFIEPNFCIYCDGNYWHTLSGVPERDKKINETLIFGGYKVLRLWENEIKEVQIKEFGSVLNKLREVN